MQQAQVIAVLLEKLEDILPRFVRWLPVRSRLEQGNPQANKPPVQESKTRSYIDKVSRFDHHLLLRSQYGKAADFAANINSNDIRK
jgi:hypothetical protein